MPYSYEMKACTELVACVVKFVKNNFERPLKKRFMTPAAYSRPTDWPLFWSGTCLPPSPRQSQDEAPGLLCKQEFLAPQVLDGVAEFGGLFKFEFAGRIAHF